MIVSLSALGSLLSFVSHEAQWNDRWVYPCISPRASRLVHLASRDLSLSSIGSWLLALGSRLAPVPSLAPRASCILTLGSFSFPSPITAFTSLAFRALRLSLLPFALSHVPRVPLSNPARSAVPVPPPCRLASHGPVPPSCRQPSKWQGTRIENRIFTEYGSQKTRSEIRISSFHTLDLAIWELGGFVGHHYIPEGCSHRRA